MKSEQEILARMDLLRKSKNNTKIYQSVDRHEIDIQLQELYWILEDEK